MKSHIIKNFIVIILLASTQLQGAYYDNRFFGPERDAVYNATVGNAARMGNWLHGSSESFYKATGLIGVGTLCYLTYRVLLDLVEYVDLKKKENRYDQGMTKLWNDSKLRYQHIAPGPQRNDAVAAVRVEINPQMAHLDLERKKFRHQAYEQLAKTSRALGIPLAAVAGWLVYVNKCTSAGRRWYNAELIGMIIAALAAIKAPGLLERLSLTSLVKKFIEWKNRFQTHFSHFF